MSSELQEQLSAASRAYYEGQPIISDAEYDQLLRRAVDEGYEPQVADGYEPKSAKLDLSRPMLSLHKIYSIEEAINWADRLPQDAHILFQPKWDGLSVQTFWRDGKFIAATRGNGHVGKDVTRAMLAVLNVNDARELEQSFDVVMNYEVVMPRSEMAQINSVTSRYTNPRNAAAGLLLSTQPDDLKLARRHLKAEPHESTTMRTVSAHDSKGIREAIEWFVSNRGTFGVDIDGIVIKVESPELRAELGTGRFAPNWARAFKFTEAVVTTTLKDVEWETGRTGRITPIAILEPVELGDSITSRATLHNVEQMLLHDLHVGDEVSIKKAGDVIPYFERVVIPNKNGQPLVPPKNCPNCDGPVMQSSPYLTCENPNCGIVPRLSHCLASLGALNVGPAFLSTYVDSLEGNLSFFEALTSLFLVRPEELVGLDRIGDRTAEIVTEAIQSVRDSSLESWIAAIGIPTVGFATAETLVAEYENLDGVISAIENGNIVDLPGFGPTKAEKLADVAPNELRSLQSFFQDVDVQPQAAESVAIQGSEYTNLRVVLTGQLPNGMTRTVAEEWLEQHGAIILGSVTSKVDLLIAGEKAGSKLSKANSLGVRVQTGEEFASRVNLS